MKEIKALDLEIETPFHAEGEAYYRLTPEMKKFLEQCEEKHGIAGFIWDGSFNFGIILKKKLNTKPSIQKK